MIAIFDLNYKKSFDNVPHWLSTAYDCCGDAHKVLVGNKCDLDPHVSYSDIEVSVFTYHSMIIIVND